MRKRLVSGTLIGTFPEGPSMPIVTVTVVLMVTADEVMPCPFQKSCWRAVETPVPKVTALADCKAVIRAV